MIDLTVSCRQRRLVHMTSNIFDADGSDKSVYSASRQKEQCGCTLPVILLATSAHEVV